MTSPEFIHGIDYSYVDRVAANIRQSAGVAHLAPLPMPQGKLLSIHLQSNRPDNFSSFIANLVASLDDPTRVEVVVKIDDVDAPMNALLPQLIAQYPELTIKYISTPLVGGFFELWRSMNDMLGVCDPYAYFLWNMNDEMAVLNHGWDSMLEKYVGLFPDHIFRLRTSVFRYRNYYDFWESGFAPETSAITTKRWIDICGNWNPCLGPDSFNQCVSYYFGWHDRFNKNRVLRDVPVHDLIFAGEGAFIGMEGEALYRRARGACKAWFRLMSHKHQNDASRRAQRLNAHIWAYGQLGQELFSVEDDLRAGEILVRDAQRKVVRRLPFQLSRARVTLTNLYRMTAYYYYGGGGLDTPFSRRWQMVSFLFLRFDRACNARTRYHNMRKRYHDARVAFHHWRHNPSNGLYRRLMSLSFLPVSWQAVEAQKQNRFSLMHAFALAPKRLWRALRTRGLNRGIRFHPSVYAFDSVTTEIDWDTLRSLLAEVTWPPHFAAMRVQDSLVKCLLLMRWYSLSVEELETALGRDLALQRFISVPLNEKLPSPGLIREFRALLAGAGIEAALYRKAELFVDLQHLPATIFGGHIPFAQVEYEKHTA